MTKRRRHGEEYVELIDSQERMSPAAASTEHDTPVTTQPKVVPLVKATPVNEGEGTQLDGSGSVEVERGRTGSPRRTVGVAANQEPVRTASVDVTGERGPTSLELGLGDRLGEGEVDLAGTDSVESHWFWELLREAGYDVW